jgi:hypothetical protein
MPATDRPGASAMLVPNRWARSIRRSGAEVALTAICAAVAAQPPGGAGRVTVDHDDTVHIPAQTVRVSEYRWLGRT